MAWTADGALRVTSMTGDDPGAVEALAAASEPAQRAALAGEPRSFRHALGERVLDVHVGPARGPDGAIAGVTGVAVDVTGAVALEVQLRQAQKLESLGRLAGTIAHDFNNMLTVIRGYGEAAAGALGPDHPATADLEEVDRAAGHAGGLVRRLLAFARREEIAREPRALNDIVREAAALLSPLAGARIVVETQLDPRAGTVRVDPGQLEQAIVNLGLNAVDALPRGGTILIETERSRVAHALLRVSDTGHGMDELTRRRAFDPFFTTKGPERGSGLGLAIVHGIVRQAGGEIELASVPGRGTTFTLRLPLSSRASLPESEPVATVP